MVKTLRERLEECRDQIIDERGLADWQFQQEVLSDLAEGARIALEMALEQQTLVRNHYGAHEVVTVPELRRLLASLGPSSPTGRGG